MTLARKLFSPRFWRRRLERRRLRRLPRATPTVSSLLGFPLEIVDGLSFLHMAQEIFSNEIYAFPCSHDHPRIIDGGANIGLSSIYFKRRFPKADVVAFEADPGIFQVMCRNLDRFGLDDVRRENRALWTHAGTVGFLADGADGGRVVESADAAGSPVPATRLKDWLDLPTDLLKLDVEGAEAALLEDCREELTRVRMVFVEYHSLVDRPQRLAGLLGVLTGVGFRIHVVPGLSSPRPFLERAVDGGMDMRLNVFAFRN